MTNPATLIRYQPIISRGQGYVCYTAANTVEVVIVKVSVHISSMEQRYPFMRVEAEMMSNDDNSI